MTLTLQQHIDACEQKLTDAGIYSPAPEAAAILAHVAGITRDDLPQHGHDVLSADQEMRLAEIMKRRMQREPRARIFGYLEFASIRLAIEDGVFEPMVESESLVEHAVLIAENMPRPLRVLDVGTGCGALLLAFLKEVEEASGIGIDINEKALALAQKNAEANRLAARAEFREGDLVEDLAGGADERFDLVLTNMPFVPSDVIPHLAPEVRLHEPIEALDGGPDGLKHCRQLAVQLPALLKPGGVCLSQTTLKAAPAMEQFFTRAGQFNVKRLHNAYGFPVALRLDLAAPKPKSWLRFFLPD